MQSEYEAPWASCKQRIDSKTGEWRYQKPVTKVRKCRQCGQCYIYCPSGCREVEETHFAANLEYCKGCSICAHECPTACISMQEEEE